MQHASHNPCPISHRNIWPWPLYIKWRLDFLKVLCFSFPVLVVGHVTTRRTFIPCSAPNLLEEFSSCRCHPITNGLTDVPSIRLDHATSCETWLELFWSKFNSYYTRVCFAGCISFSFYRLNSNTLLKWAFYLPLFEYFTSVQRKSCPIAWG